jgi:hypothetical protein
MTDRFRLSQWQLFLLLFTVSFCMTPFGFTDLYHLLERHVWVAHLAQLGVTLVGMAGVILLLRRFPGQPIQSVARQAAGPVLGLVYLLLLGAYLLFWGPVGNINTLLRITQAIISPVASPYVVTVPVILVAGYAAYFGPEVIARVTEVLAFTFLPALVVISLVPYVNAELGRVLPLRGLQALALSDPEFWSFAIGLRGFILLLALAGMVQDERRLAAPSLLSAVGSNVSMILIMVLPVAIFGQEALVRLHFPVLEAMDTVDASSVGIQSFQAITVIVWYIIAFVVVSSMLFASSHVLGSIFAISSHRKLLPWLMAGSALIASMPLAPTETAFLRHIWSLLGYMVGIGGPWLLLASAILQGKERVKLP